MCIAPGSACSQASRKKKTDTDAVELRGISAEGGGVDEVEGSKTRDLSIHVINITYS